MPEEGDISKASIYLTHSTKESRFLYLWAAEHKNN